jgi:hypothetical protein
LILNNLYVLQEGADNQPSGTARVEEPDAEALAKMSTKEREAAIK